MKSVADGSGAGVPPDFAALYVERVRVRHFRGIDDCTVELEPDLTVLVGRNNAGKSRLLRALALGLGTVTAERDDLTVGGQAEATIDIVLAPRPVEGEDDVFTDRIAQRLDSQLVQNLAEDPPQERFAWRTVIRPSNEGFGVRAESTILTYDATNQEWTAGQQAHLMSTRQRSLVVGDLVQTRRDLADELLRRGSPIRRVLDDLEVSDDRRVEIEQRLAGLGSDIVDASESLAAVRAALEVLARSIDEIGSPRLEPLPIRLEELARAVSINLAVGGTDLPLRFHGSGARSLASLQVQSVLYDRRLGKDGPALRPHPVSLIEEPEAHLHPQAQFELEPLLVGIHGQVVTTTHSTHLVSVVPPRALRQLQRRDGGVRVVDFRPVASSDSTLPRARRPSLHEDEMEKLRRLVERPFGELMFASAMVIGDGATERALLPPLIRHALPGRAHGVCVVDPGSMATPHAEAIVKFAKLVEVPWFLFADSDSEGRTAALKLAAAETERIVWVPEETGAGAKGAATERMLLDFDEAMCERACVPIGYRAGTGVLKFMSGKKGVLGRLVAAELIAKGDFPLVPEQQVGHWPSALVELVSKLSSVLPAAAGPSAIPSGNRA